MTLIERAAIVRPQDAVNSVILYKRYGRHCVAYETERGSTYDHREFRDEMDARMEFAARVAAH